MITRASLPPVAFNKILLATDFSPQAENALNLAISLARRYQAKLVLTHVLHTDEGAAVGDARPVAGEVVQGNAEENMSRLEPREELKTLPHEILIRSGDAGSVIAQTARETTADLVVMGAHGLRGVKKLLVGSIAEKVIRHASCPVLTLGPQVSLKPMEHFTHLLYATDFSSGSVRALTYALSLAQKDRANLTLLHVIASEAVSNDELTEWKLEDREKLGRMVSPDMDLTYKPEVEVVAGEPEIEIVQIAEAMNADLIVMGAHPAGPVATHMPWTTLHHVLQHAHCPVLTVLGD